ncbi:hypothetical protein MFRU_014g00450 [Monilinia fructicola]|uniref:Cupin type-1 domain-containing protein n=1 Tax=Monilinia fructicola TaxID=38448 RepID=A0A5M9K4Y9_MONFR|nr:hypothetical protein EYC84_006928 [Monilinia fructicola]KAG4029744.1 hypothetical protein MFRU_014g00450 [Monilinia fructicola]
MFPKLALASLGILVARIHCIDVTINSILDAEVKIASTQLDKMNYLLNNNLSWLFDFTTQPHYTYAPGSVVNGDAATFPASTNYGMTIALINLGPCGMLPPHYHPRGTNFVVAVEGVTQTWMVEENGAKIVNQTLRPWQMTIFPKGSIHSMQNIGTVRPYLTRQSVLNENQGCTKATLVSALNSEDAGTQNILNGFAQLPPDIMAAAFGNPIGGFNLPPIPDVGTGSILGSAACLEACRGKM